MADARLNNAATIYRRLLIQARPYWGHIFGLFLLNLLAMPIALLMPLPLKIAADTLTGNDPLPRAIETLVPGSANFSAVAYLGLAAVILILVTVGSQLQSLGAHLLASYTGERLLLDLRARVFRHLQRLSLLYHDTVGVTDSTYRLQYDTMSVQGIAVHGVIPFVTAIITLAAMFFVTFRIDWQLALVAMLICPLLFGATRLWQRRLRRQSRAVKELESSSMSVAQESLAATRVVRAFGQEEREHDRFLRGSSEGMRARLRLTVTESQFGVVVGATTAVGSASVLFLGALHVLEGLITLGELLLVMGYVGQLFGPLRTISQRIGRLQSQLASAERVFAVLDEEVQLEERPGARALGRARGAIRLEGVEFAYEPGEPALREVSIDAPAESCVGIAGRTGAGKTTLVSLIARFYDPGAGRVMLDDVDLRDYRLRDLRRNVAIVLQEPVLFATSIAENVAYARPDATPDEIVEAARAANAHEFIAALPHGYDTVVGERGAKLSSGERQRIGLARAFLKDAPVLIMDEPTSSLDIHTEAVVLEAIARLKQGRTTFIIAHRLDTLSGCDMVLVVEDGRVRTVTAADLDSMPAEAEGRPRRRRSDRLAAVLADATGSPGDEALQ